MGVPKFFRYMSERYPCLSEVIREYQIPEFDNMYLDMNSIIHMCSHPDDNNPHFRITEERIFKDVFHYIEVLFRMIRPRKLFFMAIDGVAPRAKMNQQRGRRFRAAKDAEKQEAEAIKKGETLPSEARFDSNCITPGTVFMARLHEQLKYFCVNKISTDPLWRDITVILSGHETPGEGEHKIMDYIRYLRAQPGYDPNTRHCLYGLDADLIMLGLCTHEPHFSLLREEVKFGKKSTKRQSVPEEITFFLLHLSLMREYLELEFACLKKTLVNFEFDLEKIIDDWVLMGFLVGNDFIPNLPHLHIANGALPILYKAYTEVLPSLDGYINEGGNLNLARFEKFMQQLANFDLDNFDEIRDDITYMESKTGQKFDAHMKVSTGLRNLEAWADDSTPIDEFESLEPEEVLKPRRDPGLDALIQAADELDTSSDLDEDSDEEDKAFKNFKKEYYMNKLEYSKVTPEVLRDQAEGYVRAIQWNLNYYYNGCCSWSWFYPHHYAPYISDIKGFSDLKLDFDLGTPFRPYEQLLAVLPAASKKLLPEVYHKLMTSEDSPIKQYYPEDFQTDKNGKRQEWEAVVLIPFMDEKSLFEAMRECNEQLTEEERQRNTPGPMLMYSYAFEDYGQYEAPAYFSSIKHNHSKVQAVTTESIRVPKDKLVKGLYPGVSLDVYFPGFPTMKHLKYTGALKNARVKVFEQPSRSETMIIKIEAEETDPGDFPWELVGANVFVSWPHLIEARIVSIQDDTTKYVSMGQGAQYNTEEVKNGKAVLKQESSGVVERYLNRLGVDVGPVKFLCKVQVMIGRKYVFSPNGRITLEKQFSEMTANYPLQSVVSKITAHDSYHTLYQDVTEVFPEGEICFILCNPYYGAQGIVRDNKEVFNTGRIRISVLISEEPNFDIVKTHKEQMVRNYKTLYNSASQLGMSHYLYSRITGTLFVEMPNGEGGFKNANVGLDLKFNKRNKETPGYTKKIDATWYYTDKCTDMVREYSEKFPEVFVYFADHGGKENVKAEDVFPTDDWDEKMIELQTWLRALPVASVERQPCGSQVTELELVQEIEKLVDDFYKIPNFKNVTMSIKPSFLYKPDLQSGTLPPDPKMQVELFDRIVNTRKGFSVPFGAKGTIIAIAESPTNNERDAMYDVVFDKPFDDGMQLNCSPGRGYRLPGTAFINISYGRRVYEQKTSKDSAPAANPWHNTNGQKFFNQFLDIQSKPAGNHRQIPDQFRHNRPKQAQRNEESAFASFNNSPKTVRSAGFTSSSSETSSANSNWRCEEKRTERGRENVLVEQGSNTRLEPTSVFNKTKQEQQLNLRETQQTMQSSVDLKSDRPSVNTNFLKNLLKINDTEQNASVSESKLHSPQQSLSSNVSFEMLAKNVANTSTSVQLLTYYQSNGLGIPRYQYFQKGDKYEAQITLPNGQLVRGKDASSKEEATENVASHVLNLMKKGIPTVTASTRENGSSLPEPPKTWVKSPKEKGTDQALKTALHNPFVPTQVIKRQTSKNSEERSIPEVDKKMTSGPSSTNIAQKKQKQPRKSRIAANFGKKM